MSDSTPRDDGTTPVARPAPDVSDADTLTGPAPAGGLVSLTDLGGEDAPVCQDGVCPL